MNKIYKVLWSEAKHAYVVVSELAKNHGKKSESKLAVLTLAAAVMMSGMGGAVAQAMDPVPGYADVSQYSAVGKLENGTFTPGGYWIIQGIMSALYGPYNLMAVGESSTYPYDGVASTLVGQVNFTQNANAAIVMGAGNTVTNSYRDVTVKTSELSQFMDGNKVKDIAGLKNYLQNAVKTSGGKVMAIGGANTVDNAYESQVMGVGNTLQGGAGGYDENKATRLNYIEGFYNKISGTADKPAQNDYIIGSNNTITNSKKNIIFGDNYTISGKDNNIVIGSADAAQTIDKAGVVQIGHNAKVTQDGGVAIGENSVASKGIPTEKGYGATDSDTGATWKATAAAVSVGDSTGTTKITRQITNVAAGSDDTDAVNVAQLQKVAKAADEAKTHYYSVNKIVPVGQINYNYDNEGAVADGSLAAGQNTIATGIASAVTGAYSIIGDMNEPLSKSNTWFGVKGATAASYGSFNEILIDHTSGQGKTFDGVANSVFGQANMTQNSNAAIIMGAGNTITNSYRDVDLNQEGNLFEVLKKAVPTSGGQVMAIGGGNSVDKAYQSQVMGVGNTMTGVDGEYSEDGSTRLNYIEGFYNTIEGASQNDYIIGAKNKVTAGKKNIIFGDNYTISSKDNNVVIGSSDDAYTIGVSGAVLLGHNAKVSRDGGVAIGEGSVASTAAGEFGYDPSTGKASTESGAAWKSTKAAVAVGNGSTDTRQITGVAAGTQDTDAVNVAQLKKLATYTAGENVTIKDNQISAKDTTLQAGSDALKLEGNTLSLSIKDTSNNEVTGSVDLSAFKSAVDTRNTIVAGDNIKLDEETQEDGSTQYTVSAVATGKVESGDKGLVTGDTVYKETRTASDGFVTKTTATAGENILALDKQVKTNADQIAVNTTNIANMDQRVTNNTEAINTINQNVDNMGRRINNLDSKINKVGAGAAALAALHPQDFDPDDKWDFAAGFGNYRDANAMAVGAFYRPDDRTMFSVAGNFGNGENMVNAGISVKLGKNSPYAGMDRQAMIHRLASQDRELEAQNQRIAKLEELVAQLMAK